MTRNNRSSWYTRVGVMTAERQAAHDLIMREGASEERAERWARWLVRTGHIHNQPYGDYTIIHW